MKAFKTFEIKGSAISDNSISPALSSMIQECVVDGETLAVGNENYKKVIEDCLVSVKAPPLFAYTSMNNLEHQTFC